MAISKKQQIRGVRILLTVFYGFLLSSILFRYIINGIVETIRQPTNPYAIIRIVLGTIILVSIGLSIYATWYRIKLSFKKIFLNTRFLGLIIR
jgi:FtsH-binding integral membrane protein